MRSVGQAVVLAAGNGDRFTRSTRASKLTAPVGGTPLLVRTLNSAHHAGIVEAHVILGYDAERVRALAESGRPRGLALHFHVNPEWHRENGLSVLAARGKVAPGAFAVLMGDHIFEPRLLQRLLMTPRQPGDTLLAVDRHTSDESIVAESTKVRLCRGRVTAIGKTLPQHDGLDTGLFVCDRLIFAAIDEACAAGDTTLSAGVARLAARGLVRAIDAGDTRWCDVDTVDDLVMAEAMVTPVPVT